MRPLPGGARATQRPLSWGTSERSGAVVEDADEAGDGDGVERKQEPRCSSGPLLPPRAHPVNSASDALRCKNFRSEGAVA
jgi:hypothetical protein